MLSALSQLAVCHAILTALIPLVVVMLTRGASEAKAKAPGTLKPSDKPFGMKEGIVDFVVNPKLKAALPAALQAKLADVQKRIMDGSFTVPRDKS